MTSATLSTMLDDDAFSEIESTRYVYVAGGVSTPPTSVADWTKEAALWLGYDISDIPNRFHPLEGAQELWSSRLSEWSGHLTTPGDLGDAFAQYQDLAAEIAESTFEAAAETWPNE